MPNKKNLLNIQKLIFLLNDFHYAHFEKYLEESNAALPLQLCQAIRNRLPEFDSIEQLSSTIYGDYEEQTKLKFNQLTVHTFKASWNLAIHYPNYLAHNITLCQHLINNGKLEEAEFIADTTLNIAEKIGDYSTQFHILELEFQLAVIYNNTKHIQKIGIQLDQCLDHKQLLSEIINDDALLPLLGKIKQDKILKKIERHLNHSEKLILLVARYTWLHQEYLRNSHIFFNDYNQQLLTDTIREFNNFPYIIFPYLFDLRSKLQFLKLNSIFLNLEKTEDKKELQAHYKHIKSVSFWNHMLSSAELSYLNVKATYYMGNYIHLTYRNDYYKHFNSKSSEEVTEIINTCLSLNEKCKNDKRYIYDQISINILVGALQIISGPKNQLKDGLTRLESLLTTYQQVNFEISTDSIFMLLMSGYFANKDYEACIKNFLRYQKNIKGKVIYKGNDLIIHRFYYLAKWHIKPKPLYLKRIDEMIESFNGTNSYYVSCAVWNDVIEYFNLPVEKKALS